MTPSLRQFVDENARWFRGASAETDRTLDTAEQQLGVQLPSDLRSILSEYGYWHATGISSLDETITNTLAARQHVGLPHQFIVLYDHHDGGVILLDTAIDPKTEQHRVYNAA